MYFWKIKELKSDLVKGPLSERENMKYLIATSLVWTLAVTISYESNHYDLIYGACSAAMAVIAIVCAFKVSKGHNFLSSFLAVSWVMSVRFFVVLMSLMIVLVFALPEWGDESELWDTLLFLAFDAVFFWRIVHHIKAVSDQTLQSSGSVLDN
ncbi:hypothetical protein [Vibrio sp. TRT 17S01]|uniref:hypothetical protein n=1 Tax=Vibrio sp. TRT 17S01 TaxID=3418505 RepID=UPI003CFA54BD